MFSDTEFSQISGEGSQTPGSRFPPKVLMLPTVLSCGRSCEFALSGTVVCVGGRGGVVASNVTLKQTQ